MTIKSSVVAGCFYGAFLFLLIWGGWRLVTLHEPPRPILIVAVLFGVYGFLIIVESERTYRKDHPEIMRFLETQRHERAMKKFAAMREP